MPGLRYNKRRRFGPAFRFRRDDDVGNFEGEMPTINFATPPSGEFEQGKPRAILYDKTYALASVNA
jgi:hypothetical protein